MLESLAAGTAEGFANFGGNLVMSEIENGRYRENQKQNFQLAQLAQQSAGTNQKMALANAGISPAVQNGGTFQTATPNQAPLQNKQVSMDFMGAALQAQQLKMLEAQTEQQEIINNRMLEEDKGTDIGMREQFQNLADLFEKQGYQYGADVYRDMASNQTSFNKGSLDAWERTQKMFAHMTETSKNALQNQFEAAVASRKLSNPNVVSAASLLPKATYSKMMAEISKISLEKLLIHSETEKVDAQVNEITEHIALMLEQEKEVKARAEAVHDSDFAAMMSSGEYGRAAAVFTSSVLKELIPALATKGVSSAAKKAPTPPPSRPQMTERHTTHYNKDGMRVGSTREIRSYAFPSQD